MSDGATYAFPSVTKCYDTGTGASIFNGPPSLYADPAAASGQYVAYQTVYFYYDFNAGQWTYGGEGPWMYSVSTSHQPGQWWNYFDGSDAGEGDTDSAASLNTYWAVAYRYYWYATGAAGVSTAYVWAPSVITEFWSISGIAPTHRSGSYCSTYF
jgi:hypothetical protein